MVHLNRRLAKNAGLYDLWVFDVDGVLIDTSRSFPLAIARAVQHYGQLYGYSWPLPSLSDVLQFKRYPGFNNDWDLAEGLLFYHLAQESGIKRGLAAFLEESGAYAAGKAGIEKYLRERWPGRDVWVLERMNAELIRELAMEHYAGEELFQRYYNRPPMFKIKDGTACLEKPLVSPALLEQLPGVKGIYTGRIGPELEVALELVGFQGWDPDCLFYDRGNGPRKPDPEPLLRMAEKKQPAGLVYFGDSYDDLLTLEHFRRRSKVPAEFVQIFADPDVRPFDENESWASTTSEALNEILRLCGARHPEKPHRKTPEGRLSAEGKTRQQDCLR